MGEDELTALVDAAIAETGASVDAGHGAGDGPGHAALRRPRRRQDGVGPRSRAALSAVEFRAVARLKLSVGRDLAAELGGDRDAVLDALAERAGVQVYLRGNELTLDGEQARARPGAGAGGRAVRAGGAGHLGRPADRRRRGRRARRRRPRGRRAARRRLAPSRPAGGAQDARPEALRRRHPQEHGHVRHRPGRHRQDVPRDRAGGGGAVRARGGAHHPHAAGGRGRRAARLPARRPAGQGRSRTCGRCSTRCTTCSTPTGWPPTWRRA